MTEKKTSKKDEIKELESKLEDLKQEDEVAVPGSNNNQFLIPLSIIIAGMFIAAAVYLSGGTTTGTNQVANNNQPGNTAEPVPPGTPAEIEMKEVTSDDWIKGDSNAPVKIVEYSDLECPFCQRIHATLNQIVEDYDGQVAWVYRHAPLEQLHPTAPKEAEAAECAGELGGNDAFWAFVDRVFEVGPMNSTGIPPAQLGDIAVYAGVNRAAFQTCLDSGRHADKVADSLEDAFNAGLRGTPYSVVIAPNGETYPVDGAQPYDSIKAIVDLALKAN